MASLKTPLQSFLRAQTLRPASARFPAASTLLTRQYHPTPSLTSYKDDQDRESLKPRPSEGTVTGSTYDVAEKKDAAYNPKKTDPQVEKDTAAGESNGNPLEGSGANQEFSRSQHPSEEAQDKSGKKTKSATGAKKKHGKVAPM